MKQKSKKKGNPNFLTWLVDPAKGLFSPILKGVPTALASTATDFFDPILGRQSPEVERSKEAVRAILKRTQETWDTETSKVFLEKWAVDQSNAHKLLYMTNLAFEFMTLGQVDTSLSMVYNDPMIRASFGVATSIMESEYRLGRMPFYNRWINKKYQPLLPEPYRLAEMTSKGVLEWKRYIDAMAESGLSDTWAANWASAQMEYPDLGVSLSLLRRKEIDEGTFKKFMYRSQYGADETDAMLKLKDVIPPLPDLIHMAVREAFGGHTYEEQMPALKTWGGKMGLTDEWVENYWYAHWERIPLREMYSNLWREYWTKDAFMRMLRIKDVHPDDREAIFKVAYLPPSIREMGYGYDVGAYKRDDIIRYRKWGGLSPEDAEKAADALIDYRLEAERGAVRREYLWLYAHERISRGALKANIKALLDVKDIFELWAMRGDIQKLRYMKPEAEREGRIVSSAEAKWAFKNGIRDETWLRTTLAELDWTPERIDLTVERLKFEMKPPEEVPPEVKERLLTVSQLERLFGLGEVTEEYVLTKLLSLTYSEESAALIMKLMKYAPAEVVRVKPLTTSVANGLYDMEVFDGFDLFSAYLEMGYDEVHAGLNVIHTNLRLEYPYLRGLYKSGAITIENLIGQLRSLGLTPEQANSLGYKTRRELQWERMIKERDLTKTEIIKGVKNKLITIHEGVRLMEDLGYDEWEAQYIFILNKVVVAGDPEGYWDMRRVTEAYKKARGEPSVEIPEQIIFLEKQIKEKRAEIEKLKVERAKEEVISKAVSELQAIEVALRQVVIAHKLA